MSQAWIGPQSNKWLHRYAIVRHHGQKQTNKSTPKIQQWARERESEGERGGVGINPAQPRSLALFAQL